MSTKRLGALLAGIRFFLGTPGHSSRLSLESF
jgi:hypothetical protein